MTIPSLRQIEETVAKHCDVERSTFRSARRFKRIARPRQIAMYLAREMTGKSLPDIGNHFGGRDHTTVLHAHRTIEALCWVDNQFERRVIAIRQEITASPQSNWRARCAAERLICEALRGCMPNAGGAR